MDNGPLGARGVARAVKVGSLGVNGSDILSWVGLGVSFFAKTGC